MHLMIPGSLKAQLLKLSLKLSEYLKGGFDLLKFSQRAGCYSSRLDQFWWPALCY